MPITKTKLTRSESDLLDRNLVVYNRGTRRVPIPPHSEIRIDEGRIFEQFTRHPDKMILPAGTFSYVVEASNDFFQMNIGRYCSIARGTRIVNGNHPIQSVTTNPYHYGDFFKKHLPDEFRYAGPKPEGFFERSYGRGSIGNDVWIGAHCIIRSGISIGDGAVIASGSTVVKDVPPYTIVGGNPAKPIRARFPQEIIDRLLELAWWNHDPRSFRDLNMFDVESYVSTMEERSEKGLLAPFEPVQFRFMAGRLEVL